MLLRFSTLLFFLQLSLFLNAQKQQNANWFTYFAQYRLSQHWGLHADLQFRTDERVHRTNQSLVRVGLQHLLSSTTNLTLGYALIGNYGENGYYSEHRLWQQYLHTVLWRSGHSMTHRLRLEERWVAHNDGQEGWRQGFRLRYFNRTLLPLSRTSPTQAQPYLAIQNEVFLNSASRDINPNLFDQNRLLLAVGILHKGHTRLELGYMNQYLNPPKGPDVIHHIVHLSILQVLDFCTF